MSIYFIAQIDIHDRDRYNEYGNGFMEIFNKYKGKLLVVDEDVKILEGNWPGNRTVMLQFETEEDAMDWYNSAEYQALMKHRIAASDGNLIMVKSLG
jgi:uncharacterized protein (DUF1330 family)